MIDFLKQYLLQNWDRICSEKNRPKELSFIEIVGMRNYPGKVLFLIFSDKCEDPVLLAKISRFQDDNTILEREYENLKYINMDCNDERIKKSIPIPILYEDIAGYKVLLTNAFRGISINRFHLPRLLFNKKTVASNCQKVINWLVRFHKEMKVNKVFGEKDFLKEVKEPIESFLNIFEVSNEEKNFLCKMKNLGQEFLGRETLLFFRQGDFSPANILYKKNEIKVIDWEFSKKEGLPLHDILYFFIWYGFERFVAKSINENKLTRFQTNFFEYNWYSRLVKKLTFKYCQEFKISPSLIRFFFFMLLVNLANKEYEDLLRNRNEGYMAVSQGYSEPIDVPSDVVIKNGLYVNLLRIFIKRENNFVFYIN